MPSTNRRTNALEFAARFGDEERFRVAFELAGTGIGLVDEYGRFFEVNEKLSDLFGISKEELIGKKLGNLPVPDGDTPALDPDRVTLKANLPIILERRFSSRQGQIVWVEISYERFTRQNGNSACFVVSLHDITERKLLQMELAKQASLDSLTNALNRSSFAERGEIELLRSGRHRYKVSLVMVDLDHFKNINDTFGHAVGDQVLSKFGDLVRSCLRMIDLFGRWGGEEFVILLPDTGPSDAKNVSERIRDSLDGWAAPCGARVTASLGVASYRTAEIFASLLDRADAAMFQAKQNGRNCVVVDGDDLRRESAPTVDRHASLELHWRKVYACGVPDLDAEHKSLFGIAKRLSMLRAERDSVALAAAVDELIAHIANHFKHEEILLELGRFPELEVHRLSHRKLLAFARDLAERFRQKETTAEALLDFVVQDLVARHMIVEDRKYFAWIKNGASSEKTDKSLVD
jgi:diguanylate cyclase (GGDEF)-like protein/hemerythrin-like metal-binding protein/PAS domain S-box-containing protein